MAKNKKNKKNVNKVDRTPYPTYTTGYPAYSEAPTNYNLEDSNFDPRSTPGFVELMKPASSVKGTDQMRLAAKVRELGLLDGGDNTILDFPIEEMADFIDFIGEKFSKDPAAFDEFTSTEDGIQRACDLATSFVLSVGKHLNSAAK